MWNDLSKQERQRSVAHHMTWEHEGEVNYKGGGRGCKSNKKKLKKKNKKKKI